MTQKCRLVVPCNSYLFPVPSAKLFFYPVVRACEKALVRLHVCGPLPAAPGIAPSRRGGGDRASEGHATRATASSSPPRPPPPPRCPVRPSVRRPPKGKETLDEPRSLAPPAESLPPWTDRGGVRGTRSRSIALSLSPRQSPSSKPSSPPPPLIFGSDSCMADIDTWISLHPLTLISPPRVSEDSEDQDQKFHSEF